MKILGLHSLLGYTVIRLVVLAVFGAVYSPLDPWILGQSLQIIDIRLSYVGFSSKKLADIYFSSFSQGRDPHSLKPQGVLLVV